MRALGSSMGRHKVPLERLCRPSFPHRWFSTACSLCGHPVLSRERNDSSSNTSTKKYRSRSLRISWIWSRSDYPDVLHARVVSSNQKHDCCGCWRQASSIVLGYVPVCSCNRFRYGENGLLHSLVDRRVCYPHGGSRSLGDTSSGRWNCGVDWLPGQFKKILRRLRESTDSGTNRSSSA